MQNYIRKQRLTRNRCILVRLLAEISETEAPRLRFLLHEVLQVTVLRQTLDSLIANPLETELVKG